MSLIASSSGISFGGIASGLDTEGIIARLTTIEKSSVSRLTLRKNQLLQKAEVYGSLKNQISGVAQALNSLNSLDACQSVGVGVSDTAVLSAVTTSGVQPGSYNFKISKLAQAQKLASTPQASTSAALGQSGQFAVNGKVIRVDTSDTLQSIAAKINEAGAGISAGVINGGPGQAFLTFSSGSTGVANKPAMTDISGNVLASLGVISGATSVRNPVTNGASSLSFSSSTTAIGSLTGATGQTPQTININGTSVSLDLSTDNLQTIADKINSAGAGAAASVITSITNGTTKYSLQITGSAGTPTFGDAGNTLTSLGILQQNAGNELVAAQDAQFTVDGVALTNASNTLENVIAGTKITLLKADATTPTTSTLNLTSDAGAVGTKIKALKEAYNSAKTFINSASQFDSHSFASGPLFGDSVARQFESTSHAVMFSDVPGLTGTYKNLVDIGFSLDDKGMMQVDDTKLQAAITADSSGVRKIFQNFGQTTSGNLAYVSSTSATVTSAVPYAVDITQIATKSQYVAATPKTSANTLSEKLTFGGAMFGQSTVDVVVDIGSSMADIVTKINGDPRLKDLLVASNNGGALQIDSLKYGTKSQFTLVSNQSASGANSGVGFAAGSLVNGIDVAGTIAGQAATGNGQFLSGDKSNTVASGLQVQYTGTTTGVSGTINFTSGLIGILNKSLDSYTDFTNGQTVSGQKGYETSAKSIQTQIDAINKRADEKAVELRAKFSSMEQKIQQLQSQGNQLSSLLPR